MESDEQPEDLPDISSMRHPALPGLRTVIGAALFVGGIVGMGSYMTGGGAIVGAAGFVGLSAGAKLFVDGMGGSLFGAEKNEAIAKGDEVADKIGTWGLRIFALALLAFLVALIIAGLMK